MAQYKWLGEPNPKAKLSREQLADRIERLLTTQNMCVLATVGQDGAVATPVEYYSDGLTLYLHSQAGSPKSKNIERDPRVSVGIFAPFVGWQSARGAQLFGRIEQVDPGTPGHAAAMEIYRWQSHAVQLGRPLDQPPQIPLLKLAPDRVAYTEHWLRKEGFAPRQIWRRAAT